MHPKDSSMTNRLRILGTFLAFSATTLALHAAPPGRPQINITDYVIHADLDPATGKLTATAAVTFTALDDLNVVTFGLNNGLQVTSIVDSTGAPAPAATTPAPSGPKLRTSKAASAPPPAPATTSLNSERNVTDSTIRVTPATLLTKGATYTYSFTYAGAPTVETSPVDGIKLVQIADPISILSAKSAPFPARTAKAVLNSTSTGTSPASPAPSSPASSLRPSPSPASPTSAPSSPKRTRKRATTSPPRSPASSSS